ncbi:MAG TPA: hypothetical protein ENH13_06765 [Euryarchaeota archaeon]|nr:hypothetical protein [Euryarchaeota archaeon]
MEKSIRSHIGSKYHLVGVKFLKDAAPVADERFKRPKKPIMFCQAVRKAADGEAFQMQLEDEACPSAMVALGFEEPVYIDVQPRIDPAEVKTVLIGPYEEVLDPDVGLLILNPRQAMELSSIIKGFQSQFSGSIAVCGEAAALPYMEKTANISFLCNGARVSADFRDNEVILGAPPQTFSDLAEKIDVLSKTCGALCGCKTSDIPPRIIRSFGKIGFEKSTDYFFGKIAGKNIRIYLNKDFNGKLAYMTLHLPIKGAAKAVEPFKKSVRGKWTDLSVTYNVSDIGVELNTGKGLKEFIAQIVQKVQV